MICYCCDIVECQLLMIGLSYFLNATKMSVQLVQKMDVGKIGEWGACGVVGFPAGALVWECGS